MVLMVVSAQGKASSQPGHGGEGAMSLLDGPSGSNPMSSLLPSTALRHPSLPGEGSPCLSSPSGEASLGCSWQNLASPLSPWPSEGSSSPWCGDRSGRRHTLAHAAHPRCTHNSLGVHGKLSGSFYLPVLRQLSGFIWLSRQPG